MKFFMTSTSKGLELGTYYGKEVYCVDFQSDQKKTLSFYSLWQFFSYKFLRCICLWE